MRLPCWIRHLLWRRRCAAARAWQEAERAQAAQHSAAIRAIVERGRSTPDPVSDPGRMRRYRANVWNVNEHEQALRRNVR